MNLTNQDPATWVAATPGSAAWRRKNDGLIHEAVVRIPGTVRAHKARVDRTECAQSVRPDSRPRGDLDRAADRPFGDAE
jgi:hypothetical protein